MKKEIPHRTISTSPPATKRTKGRIGKTKYLRSIYMGSEQAVYELHRQASISGAGTPSGLIRIWSNRAKKEYTDRLTLLEQQILEQTQLGNVEVGGLLSELRQVHDNGLTANYLQLALNSLVERQHLICAQRGGKTEKARGAKIKCYFPYGSPLGSDFQLAQPAESNFDNEEE